MASNKKLTMIAITFTWCGLIIGISFLESWLKFKAPHVTLSIGLGIGQLVFEAMNKIEWIFGIIILLVLFKQNTFKLRILFLIVFTILLLQTVWLLPVLNGNVLKIQTGIMVKNSMHHFVYVVFEIIKLISLIRFGVHLNYHESK